jgi:hypothetical protein
MKNLKQYFLPFCFAILFFSCKKDKDSSGTPSKTKTELITQSTWKFSTATVGGSDVSSFLQSCQKDNILTFVKPVSGTTGDGSADEGATKCNSGDPQTNPFTWYFQSNETSIHISTVLFSGGSSDFNLVSVTTTELVVSQDITIGGPSQNAVVTFVH